MSKFKTQSPITHIPSFKTYQISGGDLMAKLVAIPVTIPLGMFDSHYFYTDLEGWNNVLWDLTFNSNLYKDNSFDCENYAMKAMSICAETYGLNAFGLVIGNMPLGRHGFNIFYWGGGFMLHEPNSGYGYGGYFPIGEHGYIADLVVI